MHVLYSPYGKHNMANPSGPTTVLILILKASLSFPQITHKFTQTHTLYTSLSFYIILPYFIKLDKNNAAKNSHPI